MGKITGFMDYTRKTSSDIPPLERIENFNEFHVWLSREEQQTQAARCPSGTSWSIRASGSWHCIVCAPPTVSRSSPAGSALPCAKLPAPAAT